MHNSHDHGAVAQLGERVNGIHEVRGPIPLSSTIMYYVYILVSTVDGSLYTGQTSGTPIVRKS